MSLVIDTSYIAFLPRLSHLATGVLTQLLVSQAWWRPWVERHVPTASVLAIAALTLVTLTCFGNRFGPHPDPTHPLADPIMRVSVAVGLSGVLQPLALAYILAYAVASRPQSMLYRFLTGRFLSTVARLSYDVYLLHPMVVLGVWTIFPPDTWFWLPRPSPWPFLGVSTLVLLASLAAAAAHAALWEGLLHARSCSLPVRRTRHSEGSVRRRRDQRALEFLKR